METLIRRPSRVMIYLLNKVCFTFMVSESVISCIQGLSTILTLVILFQSFVLSNICICMHRNINSLISETPSLLFWILLNNLNTRSKPTLATMMDVGFDSRADVNYISRASRELKLTDNRANKAEVNAGHFEGFLKDKKTKLISGETERRLRKC